MRKRHRTITPEMLEAIRRGERPLFPDGSRLPRKFGLAYAPLAVERGDGEILLITPSLRGRLHGIVIRLRGEDRTVRLAPDYGVEVPLWPQDDEIHDLIPEGLMARLIAWQDEWHGHYKYEVGWDSDDARERWEREGKELGSEVRAVLPKRMKLKVDV